MRKLKTQKRPSPRRKLSTIVDKPAADNRPIVITGSLAGVVVATDKSDSVQKAEQVARSWRESGLTVVVA